jgi:tetratricopeptide (TPR) repeat protein
MPWTRVVLIGLMMAGVSTLFGGRFLAGLTRQLGERAYLAGDFGQAWRRYERAAAFGGSRLQLETDRAELLLFGLDQRRIGVKVDLPLDESTLMTSARNLLASLLAEAPYRAYLWSLASDFYLHEAFEVRRRTPIDLSALSDNPRENLLPQEILAAAAMAEAARREPRNYVYEDLLAEQFLEWGLAEVAMPLVRRSVALYPVLDGHIYLARPRLDPEIVAATVAGFGDALRGGSMVGADNVESDLGRFLANQGRHDEAIAPLRRAMALNPDNPNAALQLGLSSYFVGDDAAAVEYLTAAGRMIPDMDYGWYYVGLAQRRLGEKAKAIEAFRKAREAQPRQVQYFHALADLLEEEGRMKEAERQFLAAANLNQESVPAWLALLGFYERHPDLKVDARRLCIRLAGLRLPEDLYKERCAAMARRAW